MLNLQNAQQAVAPLLAALDSGEDLTPEQLTELVLTAYNGSLEEFRPLIATAPALGGQIGQDLAPIITAIVKLGNGIITNEEFQKEYAAYRAAIAKQRFGSLEAYTTAGFSREEAFALVLQDSGTFRAPTSVPISFKTTNNVTPQIGAMRTPFPR